MNRFTTLFVASMMLVLGLMVWGQATQPTTQASDGPTISPAAATLLGRVRDAYAKLDSLDLSGSLALKLDAGGVKSEDSVPFTAFFQAPDKFRHEAKDDLLLISNTEKAYGYKPDVKKYITFDALKDRQELFNVPEPVGPLLLEQNPSLLMALLTDGTEVLKLGASSIDQAADAAIDGKNYNVLLIKGNGKEARVFIDPQTQLIRRVETDLKQHLINVGLTNVNSSVQTLDYAKATPAVKFEAGKFTWVPPTDALLIKLQVDSAFDSDGDEAALALVGKPAPLFSLKDLAGKDVSLGSLKGSVVVLDFWATWCGPCRMSLPHLDALHKELSPRGVKVFAIDQAETKSAVQNFITAAKLTVPVLLDENSAVGESYKVTGIPQTVVIGKDGIIRKVFIGFGPGGEVELRKSVEAAMQ